MADSLPSTTETPPKATVVVKKYANRRLYNTETSSYITLENLAEMIRAGRDFVVYDAKSGDDITRGVLTQIIVEEESKGTSMLPTNFLRQLIGFYGDSLQGVVPRYLESAMSNFARQQQQMRQVMQQTFSPFLPTGVEEIGRQNIALMERAMSYWYPFQRQQEDAPFQEPAPASGAEAPQAAVSAEPSAPGPELEGLRHEVESLRAQLAIARAASVIAHAPHPAPEPAAGHEVPPFGPVMTEADRHPAAPEPVTPPVKPPVADVPKPAPLSITRKARTGKRAY